MISLCHALSLCCPLSLPLLSHASPIQSEIRSLDESCACYRAQSPDILRYRSKKVEMKYCTVLEEPIHQFKKKSQQIYRPKYNLPHTEMLENFFIDQPYRCSCDHHVSQGFKIQFNSSKFGEIHDWAQICDLDRLMPNSSRNW
jgi:hypothetical protein